MERSSEGTLATVLEVHIVVVITITYAFKTQTRSILELLWDRPPVEIVTLPRKWRHAISGVNFEYIEARSESESGSNTCFPEAGPFNNSIVLVDRFTSLEVKCGIWRHRWSLNEWLVLIARMCWSSFDSNDTLNGLFTHYWISESVRNMWELLIVTPFYFILVTLVMIIVRSRRPVFQGFLMIQLLSLWEPCPCWLPPSVVVFEVLVVKLGIWLVSHSFLIESLWDVALCIQVIRSYLRNMHIDHVGVVPINVKHLFFVISINIDWVLDVEVLVR